MSLQAVIGMVIILGITWGGFLASVILAARMNHQRFNETEDE